MSRGALVAIVAGIIIAAIAAGIVASTNGNQQIDPEDRDAAEGRHLTLDLNENLALKENP